MVFERFDARPHRRFRFQKLLDVVFVDEEFIRDMHRFGFGFIAAEFVQMSGPAFDGQKIEVGRAAESDRLCVAENGEFAVAAIVIDRARDGTTAEVQSRALERRSRCCCGADQSRRDLAGGSERNEFDFTGFPSLPVDSGQTRAPRRRTQSFFRMTLSRMHQRGGSGVTLIPRIQ